jgi:dTDP-4-amino-4,6-dideoxygalactose transaminase
MAGRIDKYEWIDVGSSYIPNEVSCAILLSQLQQALPITEIRLYNHARYRRGLLSLQEKGWIRLSGIPEYGSINGHIMYIILPSLEQRIKMEQELKLRGISSFSHYVPLHSSPAGKKYCKIGCNNMSVTQATYGGLLRLPVWVGLRDDQIDYVISSVTEICQNFNQV